MSAASQVWHDVQEIRTRAPLVHNITNFVVMNTTTNALLAIGASPVMAHAEEEVEEMVSFAGALVINIGTLRGPWIEAMKRAMRAASGRGVPIVLDPVGAGATRLRTDTCFALMEAATPAIVRGNASEIRALAGGAGETKGVDSAHGSDEAVDAATALADRLGSTVVVSGAEDVIVGGGRVRRVGNGDVMMTRVTGMGCTATALLGAFAAVNENTAAAAAHGMAVMGVCGEMAAERSAGPGSLQMNFYDALDTLTQDDLGRRLKLEA